MRSPEAGAGLRQGRVGVILLSEGMIAEAQLEEPLASPGGAICSSSQLVSWVW